MTKSREHTWYVDSDERVIRSDMTNRHHLIFPAWRYEGQIQLQQFRGLGGFIQRLTIMSHNDLHRALEPPVQPHKNLRNELVKLQFARNEETPLARLDSTIEFLGKIVARDNLYPGEYQRDALALIDNLQRQREFIEIGRVTLLDEQ